MLCFFILCSHPLHLPCHNLTSSPCSGIEPGKDRDAGKEGLDERMREASISAGQFFETQISLYDSCFSLRKNRV